MADDTTAVRAITAPRLLAGATVATLTLAWAAPAALAANAPALTSHQVTFEIPANSRPHLVWTLNVWQHGTRLATTSGSTGVLVVLVPRTVNGVVQADVLRNQNWYSGRRFDIANSTKGGGGGHGHGGGSGGKGSGKGAGSGGKGSGHHSTGSTTTTTTTTSTTTTTTTTTVAPGSDPRPGSTPDTTSTPESALAFTGVGSLFRDVAVGGVAMELAGLVLLLARRRRARLFRP